MNVEKKFALLLEAFIKPPTLYLYPLENETMLLKGLIQIKNFQQLSCTSYDDVRYQTMMFKDGWRNLWPTSDGIKLLSAATNRGTRGNLSIVQRKNLSLGFLLTQDVWRRRCCRCRTCFFTSFVRCCSWLCSFIRAEWRLEEESRWRVSSSHFHIFNLLPGL